MSKHSLELVRSRCSEHLNLVADMFKPNAKLTLLVRQPGFPDQDFMMTNDSLDEAISMLERSKGRESSASAHEGDVK